MSATDEQYVTVAEAAELLRVAPSTIRRWIRQGDLPAFRIGKRRVALRQSDVETMVAPVGVDAAPGHTGLRNDPNRIRKLTPEEVQRALEALERLKRRGEEIMARRGGKPLRPSLEIIHEMREERMRELG